MKKIVYIVQKCVQCAKIIRRHLKSLVLRFLGPIKWGARVKSPVRGFVSLKLTIFFIIQ